MRPSLLSPDCSVNTQTRVAKGPRSHISVAVPGSRPGRWGQGRGQCLRADGRLATTGRTLSWPACSAGQRKPTGWPLCPLTGRGLPRCRLLVPTARGAPPPLSLCVVGAGGGVPRGSLEGPASLCTVHINRVCTRAEALRAGPRARACVLSESQAGRTWGYSPTVETTPPHTLAATHGASHAPRCRWARSGRGLGPPLASRRVQSVLGPCSSPPMSESAKRSRPRWWGRWVSSSHSGLHLGAAAEATHLFSGSAGRGSTGAGRHYP